MEPVVIPANPVELPRTGPIQPTSDTASASAKYKASKQTLDPSDRDQLAAHLDYALQNSAYKTEIINGRNGATFVRIVQASTGQLLMQLPPQAVLDLVAALKGGGKGAEDSADLPTEGTMLDQLA